MIHPGGFGDVLLAVPAMAQNVNNGDHFNQQDGSAPQTGENRTEIELEAATAAITSFLESERGARIDVRGAYLDAFSESHTDDVLDALRRDAQPVPPAGAKKA